jgi:hypothetical protein
MPTQVTQPPTRPQLLILYPSQKKKKVYGLYLNVESLFFVCFFETGFLCVALAVLELTL